MTDAFWSKVRKTDTCWLWTASRDHKSGYARYDVPMGKRTYVHRLAYELVVGPIAEGLTIDHLCRVRHCVNPDHLEAVTMRENILRGTGTAAIRAKQTQCVRGHPFTPMSTYVDRHGHRMCRVCQRARMRAARSGSTMPKNDRVPDHAATERRWHASFATADDSERPGAW